MAHSSHDLFPEWLIVALGGNAIHPEGINGTTLLFLIPRNRWATFFPSPRQKSCLKNLTG